MVEGNNSQCLDGPRRSAALDLAFYPVRRRLWLAEVYPPDGLLSQVGHWRERAGSEEG